MVKSISLYIVSLKSQNFSMTLSEHLLHIVYPNNKSICIVMNKYLALSKTEK